MNTQVSRRRFLGWTAVGATGLLVPKIVKPRPTVFDMGRNSISDKFGSIYVIGPNTFLVLTIDGGVYQKCCTSYAHGLRTGDRFPIG